MNNYPNIMELIDKKLREQDMYLEYNRNRVKELEAENTNLKEQLKKASVNLMTERESFFQDTKIGG